MSLLESNTDALERLMEEVNNLPNPNPNGASVQSDWNQTDETAADFIKNKPFGEFEDGLDTLVWKAGDFNEDIPVIMDMFFLASDAVFNVNDLSDEGFTITLDTDGKVFTNTVTKNEVLNDEENLILSDGLYIGQYFLIIPFDNYDLSALAGDTLIIPKKGIYMVFTLGQSDFEIQFHGITIFPGTKILDKAYLPSIPYDKMPGKVILYHDNEGYLYTEDTSDTSKRLTRKEFIKLLDIGVMLWLYQYPFGYIHNNLSAIQRVDLHNDYASVYGMATINGSGTERWLYTAEYVPES